MAGLSAPPPAAAAAEPSGDRSNIRLDPDLLDRLRATGPGWQTRLNEALRDWLAKHAA